MTGPKWGPAHEAAEQRANDTFSLVSAADNGPWLPARLSADTIARAAEMREQENERKRANRARKRGAERLDGDVNEGARR